ncbi:MAG TPA: NYN domain-containing protein [Acidimicrobiales bacterium]|nr:NYN domain-containing protein [Acidimicrobiales bacterium]
MPLVRHRRHHRGVAGSRGLSAKSQAPAPADVLVRPALHVAFVAARAGLVASPPVEPPRGLRPFLHFVKLPDQALAALRRALDEDEDFRSRAAEAAGEDELGRASWLFLNRPPGWEEELAELAGQVEAAAEDARSAKEERTAVRRLAQAEQAVERAQRQAAKARAEAAGAAAELAEERRSRREAEAAAEALARRVAVLEEEAAAGRRKAADAKVETSRWRTKVAGLERDLARAATRPSLDPGTVHAAITAAEDALQEVRRALLEEQARMEAGDASARGEGGEPGQLPVSRSPMAAPAGAARRLPARLPPAVFEESVQAAAHLVRVPNVLVIVDGYNAAMSIWPGVSPEELRQRLVDALSELSARTGAEVHVVFDGAELGGSVSRAAGRLPVRVTFSPPDVEADDVILAMVDDIPADRPVVVASSDRRVQDGARSRGANVVSSPQLGELLGR